MKPRTLRRTYIREWRLKSGLSLRELADRMEEEPGGDLLISHASLGRIERGMQPYSQPILEAISTALAVPVSALLEINPAKAGDVVDLMRLLNSASPEQRSLAIDLASRAIRPAGTNN